MLKKLLVTFRLFALSLLTLNFLCTHAHAEPEFTFGYITDLTSRGAMLGKRSVIGVGLAQKELGDNVRVIIDDHQTDAKVAATQAQRLIAIDKVDALLCDLTMPCIAASEVAFRAKVPFFYQSTSQSVLDKNPYAFRNFIDYRENCRALATLWKEKGFTKVGSLAANGEYSELCVKGVKDVYGDATIEYFNSGDETRTQLLRLARSGIEAITLTGFEVDFINTFNARELEHLTNLQVGCISAILTPNVRSQYPQGLKNIWRMEFPFVTKDFALKVKEKDTEPVVSNYESAAIAYTAVHALYDGLKKCGKNNPECVMKALPSKPVVAPLPFQGFKDRKAVYPPIIKYYETLPKE